MRAALFALAIAATVAALTLAEWDVAQMLSHTSRTASTVFEIAVALAIAFAFRPVHQRIEGAVEHAFTRRRHEARKKLFVLARSVTDMRDADALVSEIVSAIDQSVGGGGSALYLKDAEYHAVASSLPLAADISITHPLVESLRAASSPVDVRKTYSGVPGSMACPMLARGELVGFVLLNAPPEHLDPDDRQTLMTLAQSAGLALAVLRPQLLSGSRERTAQAEGNLPYEVSTLLGRDSELLQLSALMETRRIVCVKGPGGIGKSRLALRAASLAASRFDGGRWFVDLSGANAETDVLAYIAGTLGVPESGGKTQLRNLIEFIGDRRVLLLLDNCEHVAATAARACTDLLQSISTVQIIATSRERLAIAGEAVFEVPPLGLAQARQLFLERAKDVAPHVRPDAYAEEIAEILDHLDGIPFAVELAAARLRVLSPRELARRIHNVFQTLTEADRGARPQKQTLRAVLDWSFALLSPPEQALFCRLGVFASTFTIDAAAAVCRTEDLAEDEVVGLIGHLVDKSLLQAEAGPYGARFRLLEAGRVYAREQTSSAQRADLAARHAGHYVGFTREVTRHPAAGRYDVGLEQLRLDIDNVYAALAWAIETADVEAVAQLGEDLGRYWFHYTQLRTGREWLAKILELEGAMNSAQRASVHFANACMLLFSDPQLALESAEIAVRCAEETGERRLMAQALGAAGNAQLSLGNAAEAERAYEHSAAIYDELDPEKAVVMRMNLANVLINFDSSQLDRAQEMLERALEIAQRSGKKGLEGIILGNMAQLAYTQGRSADAYTLSRRSVETARALGARQQEAVWLYWLGVYATELGRQEEAAGILQQALLICREILTDDPEHFTGCMEAVVTFAAGNGRMLDAARIHGFIESYRKERRLPRPPVLERLYAARLSGVRDKLGEAQFQEIAASGSHQSLEELIAIAHAIVEC